MQFPIVLYIFTSFTGEPFPGSWSRSVNLRLRFGDGRSLARGGEAHCQGSRSHLSSFCKLLRRRVTEQLARNLSARWHTELQDWGVVSMPVVHKHVEFPIEVQATGMTSLAQKRIGLTLAVIVL